MLINWSEINSVGVYELDEQHKKLVGLINDLSTLLVAPVSDLVLPKFAELKKLGEEHCMAEEKYFELFNFPEKETHKKEHALYLEKIAEYAKRYLAGDKAVANEALDFSRQWWVNHINSVDLRYTKCFNEHGLY